MTWFPAPAPLAVLLLGAAGCGGAAGAPRGAESASVFIPFTAVAAPAAAAPVARVPLERPGHYRVAFSARREHGCSLSYAVTDARGEYALDLASDGRAELTVTSITTYVFGSRMGPPTTESTTAGSSWKGEARQTAGHLVIALQEARASCGGRACPGPKSVKLTCAFERVDVASAPEILAEDAPDAPPGPVPLEVLRCKGGPSPFGDEDPAFAEHLALSGTAALAMSSRAGRWSGQETPALFLERPSP